MNQYSKPRGEAMKRSSIASFLPILLVFLVLWVTSSACGGGKSPAREAPPGAGELTYLPHTGLVDWVTYGQQVSVISVLSEEQMPMDASTREHGEGYVGRTIRFHVDRTIWSAPNAVVATGEVRMLDWGWLLKDGNLFPFTSGRMEVGKRYLAPLATIRGGLASMAVAPIELSGDEISGDAGSDGRWQERWVDEDLAGMEVSTLAETLTTTAIDPIAAPYMNLPALERAEAVREAKGEWRITSE